MASHGSTAGDYTEGDKVAIELMHTVLSVETTDTASEAYGEIWTAAGMVASTRKAQYSTDNGVTWNDLTKGEMIKGDDGFWWIRLYATTTVGSDNKVDVRFFLDGGLVNLYHFYDNISCQKVSELRPGYGGSANIFMNTDFGLSENSHKGWVYLDGALTTSAARGWVRANTAQAIYLENMEGTLATSATTLYLSENYQWRKDGNNQYFDFFDRSLLDGTQHLSGGTSLQTKYIHSKFINGRNYVANVQITNDDGSESHENWVIYSEFNQPDVLPITNYIQISDAQGGSIIGLENLLGDLAVFMERGIYRLSIPSIDPTSWSLSESEENIGCISTDSIQRWEAGVFFAGKGHLYFLDANFQAVPITKTIRDDYQALAGSDTRVSYDPKKNKLLCRFGSDGGTIYELDLSVFPEEKWSKRTMSARQMDLIIPDEDLTLYSIDTASNEARAEDGSKDETVSFKRTTGWVNVGDIDKSGVIRRLNLKYKSGDAITANFYIDGDSSTAVKTLTIPADTSGSDWYRSKPGFRARSFMLELSTSASSNDVEIRNIEVEYE